MEAAPALSAAGTTGPSVALVVFLVPSEMCQSNCQLLTLGFVLLGLCLSHMNIAFPVLV